MKIRWYGSLLRTSVLFAAACLPAVFAQAVRTGFTAAGTQSRADDIATGPIPIGFPINFFGTTYSQLFVGTNGYVTFDFGKTGFDPENLVNYSTKIIAGFYGDVDTSNAQSGLISWGQGTVGGRQAFATNWTNVGYFNSRIDKQNTFQIVIISRSDRAQGDFDFELNYNQIQWETGDFSGGTNGLCIVVGCLAPTIGYSNGLQGAANRSFEFPGSHSAGAFLDRNTQRGLRYQQFGGSGVNGRLLFAVTNGVVTPLTITNLNPASVAAGAAQTPLIITGTGFAPNAAVRWTFNSQTTNLENVQVASTTQINVPIPANLLLTAGTAQVVVTNPTGSPSAPATFTITGSPTIISLDPPSAAAGSPALDMNIIGIGFASGATASWIPAGGQPAPLLVSFKSSILLVATITADQLRTGGSVQVTVKNPTGDPSLPGTFTIIAGPTINITNGLSPSSAPVNSAPVSLTVTGTGFVSTSKVRWNGTELTPTTVDSTTQLRATIPLNLLAVAGPVPITVINSPTGAPSNAVSFNVIAGPTINTTNGLSPSSTAVNSPLTILTVAGTGFISGSKVRWNGTELVTIFDSITQLRATIPANLLTVVGSVPITVINSPTGTPSNAITFNVVAGPTINVTNGLSPVSAVVNSGPITLTVNGTGFLSTSRVRWNGSDLVTNFGSATQLSTTIPTNLLTTAGTAQVTVSNNGSLSNSVTFAVTETIPTISTNGLSITSAPVNSPATQITVTGTGFVPQSKVLWKGGELITMFDSATQLRANITLALLAIAGPAQVTVINSPTGTPSNVATFTVVSPTPVNFSTFTATTGIQPTLNLTLGAAATSKLTGALDLTFAPASGVAGLLSVFVSKEVLFSNSSPTLPFTVDPGSTTVAIPNSLRFSQGTVAGTVTVTMTSLSNSLGASVLPSPRPSASVVIDSAVPVTTSGSVKILNVTSSGFSVEVQGFTTTRDLTSATFVFTAGSGTQLDGSTTFTQPLTGTAPAWFSSTAGINGGGGFLLSMPFTFSGDTSALGNVSVTLSNSKGTSVSVNGGR